METKDLSEKLNTYLLDWLLSYGEIGSAYCVTLSDKYEEVLIKEVYITAVNNTSNKSSISSYYLMGSIFHFVFTSSKDLEDIQIFKKVSNGS